jgi:hypothetical protein
MRVVVVGRMKGCLLISTFCRSRPMRAGDELASGAREGGSQNIRVSSCCSSQLMTEHCKELLDKEGFGGVGGGQGH